MQMRIAIICSDDEKRKKLVNDVIQHYAGTFATPAVTLFDEKIEYPEKFNTDEFTKKYEDELENELYKRILFNAAQLEQYRKEKNIIYNGCSLDIVAQALFHGENETVSDEFVENIIYRSKQNIRDLDLIYYLPIPLDKIEDEDAKRLEQIHYNVVNVYLEEDTEMGLFPATDCPGVVVLETDNPISEIKEIVAPNGDLTGDEENPQQIQALMDAIKDPRLREDVEKLLTTPSIPLVGGGTASAADIVR